MVTPKRPKPKYYGLEAKHYPRNIREHFDYDYIDKLSEEEKAWLARFNEGYYGADFRWDTEGEWSTEQRRKAYRAKNSANRGDLLGVIKVSGFAKCRSDRLLDQQEGELSAEQTPKYLNSAEYKKALKEYRALILSKASPEEISSSRRKLELFTYEPEE